MIEKLMLASFIATIFIFGFLSGAILFSSLSENKRDNKNK